MQMNAKIINIQAEYIITEDNFCNWVWGWIVIVKYEKPLSRLLQSESNEYICIFMYMYVYNTHLNTFHCTCF